MKRSELFFTFVLLPLDVAMFILSFITAFYLRAHIDLPLSAGSDLREYFLYSLFMLPVMIILFSINGLYRRRNYNGYWHELYAVLSSVSMTILILIVAIFVSNSLFFSRLILAYTWVLAVVFISLGRIILRAIEKYLLRFNIGVRNVILVGNNGMTGKIIAELENQSGRSYKILGIVSTSDKEIDEYENFGEVIDAAKIIKSNAPDEVILTDVGISNADLMKIIEACESHHIDFQYVPDIFNVLTTNFQPTMIGSTYAMELKKTPLEGWGRISKRIIDVIIAALFLVILSPLFLIIGIFVKITSRGPIIYRQERVGRDERKFWVYKFRSMRVENKANKSDAWTTAVNEQRRVTMIGRILRKTNLDEIPQFWNIFIGNMSFVGPRPEQPQFVDKFESEIPEYFRRHHVKSGLTGWAQVNGLKGDTSIEERVRYDIYYIENWSLWFDFKIIIKTIGLLVYETLFGKFEYRSRP